MLFYFDNYINIEKLFDDYEYSSNNMITNLTKKKLITSGGIIERKIMKK